MPPLVTAVIPTYNYARYLPRAIESALSQSYEPLEVVVVDDGSTDETSDVLARYDGRVRVIRQANRGLAAARNTGAAAAHGELVALLDADDEWHPHKIARQVELYLEFPDSGVVGCANEVKDHEGRPYRLRHYPNASLDRIERLRAVALRKSWVGSSGSGALLPRRVLDAVGGFDEKLPAAEDWDMWLRIAARYPIRNVHQVLTTIYFHRTGSFRNAAKMERSQWGVYERVITRWPDAFDEATRRKVRAMIRADAAGEYIALDQASMALQRSLQSLRLSPADVERWAATAHALVRTFVR